MIDEPHIELGFNVHGHRIEQRVPLVSQPSNLGIGVVWFFRCPRTGKKCRKLHFLGRGFYHRSVVAGYHYRKQTESHHARFLRKMIEEYLGDS
jgi:hypothetical protein